MNRLAQEAIIVGLVRRLDENGSWCGETHIQKAAYLVRDLFRVDFDFRFILYKHGPFSFELREELGSMRADRLLERVPQPAPYGPRTLVTARGRELEGRMTRTMARNGPALNMVADWLGSRGVLDLERLATALWVTERARGSTVEDRARELTHVKPHVPLEQAVAAVTEVEQMLVEAKSVIAERRTRAAI